MLEGSRIREMVDVTRTHMYVINSCAKVTARENNSRGWVERQWYK